MTELTMGIQATGRTAREYTAGEEALNAATHGLGALLAAAACALLVAKAAEGGGGAGLAAAVVFGSSLLIEYVLSTLYHAASREEAKRLFKVLDHCGIYLLIAGSYTPYCLISLDPSTGFPLLAAVWIVAVAGMAVEAFWTFRPRWVSAAIYLAMGWCIVAFLPALLSALGSQGFGLLAASGLVYTAGAACYVMKRLRYLHSVFHVLVLGGSVLQFLSVYLYVL